MNNLQSFLNTFRYYFLVYWERIFYLLWSV